MFDHSGEWSDLSLCLTTGQTSVTGLCLTTQVNGRLGSSVAIVDINQDGLLDIAAGAPSSGSSQLTYYVSCDSCGTNAVCCSSLFLCYVCVCMTRVCVCVCVCVCMYVCLHVHECMHACVCVFIHVFL